MLILSQNGEVMVNLDRIHSISTYKLMDYERNKATENKVRVLAWFGTGEYLHRQGGPAILGGSIDVPEAFLVLPKIYEMSQE